MTLRCFLGLFWTKVQDFGFLLFSWLVLNSQSQEANHHTSNKGILELGGIMVIQFG